MTIFQIIMIPRIKQEENLRFALTEDYPSAIITLQSDIHQGAQDAADIRGEERRERQDLGP